MEASILIRLIDQVSGPAGKLRQSLKGIGDAAGEMKRGFGQAIRQGLSVENIEQATRNAEAALTRARSRLIGAVGMAMAIAAPVRAAAQFDQAMKGLEKVVDAPIERLTELRKFALDTSALIPVAANDIVELMAEAAQGGVPVSQLEAFVSYVANAAVAFDMSGQAIGEAFAKLRNVYRLNQEGIEDLGDATNHLSNNMAAKAPEIVEFANRANGAAGILKLSATQTAALGAAMIAAGIVPETAGRGITAMATRILSGGKEIDRAFKSVGMSRKAFLKSLEEDGPAALQNLFTTLAESENGMEALIDIVGRDFADDFAKFLSNPELLAEAFRLVSDPAAYAGSAIDEAGKQAEGATKRWELLVNKITRVGIVLGEQLLPPLLEAADAIGSLVDRMAAFASANPELTSSIVQTVAGLMAFSVATRVLGFAFAGTRVGLIGLVSLFGMFGKSGRNVAMGWRLLAVVGRGLAMAIGLVKWGLIGMAGLFAGISAPVWALIAALIAAGFALWKYWDAVSSFVSGFAAGLSGLAEPVADAIGWLGSLLDKMIEFVGIDPAVVTAGLGIALGSIRRLFDVTAWIEPAKAALDEYWGWLSAFFTRNTLTDDEKGEYYAAGQRMAEQLVKGIMDWLSAKLQTIRDLFNFDVTIQWPEPPAWLSWLIERGGGMADRVGAALFGDAVPGRGTEETGAAPEEPATGRTIIERPAERSLEDRERPAPGRIPAPGEPATGRTITERPVEVGPQDRERPAPGRIPVHPVEPHAKAGLLTPLVDALRAFSDAIAKGVATPPPPVQPAAPAAPAGPPGGTFSTFLNGMDRLDSVGAEIEQGGRSVAEGGQHAGDAIRQGGNAAGAELVRAAREAASALRGAARGIGGGYSEAISAARTGALHDGVE